MLRLARAFRASAEAPVAAGVGMPESQISAALPSPVHAEDLISYDHGLEWQDILLP
jgi:hypothetical protein